MKYIGKIGSVRILFVHCPCLVLKSKIARDSMIFDLLKGKLGTNKCVSFALIFQDLTTNIIQ
jgi:hypothetical protein